MLQMDMNAKNLTCMCPTREKTYRLLFGYTAAPGAVGTRNIIPQRSISKPVMPERSINYRLSQHAVFPAQIEDVKAAVRWLRANAETYRLDPNRFAAWGSSAGGHLVAMLGTTGDVAEFEVGENLKVSSQVQAVVDYFGPTDFLQMDAQSLPDGLVHDAPDSPESQLVGGPIQEHKDRVTRANPITYVSKDDCPFLIIHGDQDKLVPYQQSVLLKDALEEAGVRVTFYRVAGGSHGWFGDPKVPELTKSFLKKHLKP